MITLSSKSHFQKLHTPDQLAAVKQGVDNTVTRTAMIYVMAQIADELALSTDPASHKLVLYGARLFRDKLLNITEPEAVQRELPRIELEDVPMRPKAINTEKK